MKEAKLLSRLWTLAPHNQKEAAVFTLGCASTAGSYHDFAGTELNIV